MYGMIIAVYDVLKDVNIALRSMFHHVSKQLVL